MKLLRMDANYERELTRTIWFLPDHKLIRLKKLLIAAGNSHLLKGQYEAYDSAYSLINKINMIFEHSKKGN